MPQFWYATCWPGGNRRGLAKPMIWPSRNVGSARPCAIGPDRGPCGRPEIRSAVVTPSATTRPAGRLEARDQHAVVGMQANDGVLGSWGVSLKWANSEAGESRSSE